MPDTLLPADPAAPEQVCATCLHWSVTQDEKIVCLRRLFLLERSEMLRTTCGEWWPELTESHSIELYSELRGIK